jgi:hypothetical protein
MVLSPGLFFLGHGYSIHTSKYGWECENILFTVHFKVLKFKPPQIQEDEGPWKIKMFSYSPIIFGIMRGKSKICFVFKLLSCHLGSILSWCCVEGFKLHKILWHFMCAAVSKCILLAKLCGAQSKYHDEGFFHTFSKVHQSEPILSSKEVLFAVHHLGKYNNF